MQAVKRGLGRVFAIARAYRPGMAARAVIVAFHSISVSRENAVTRTARDFELFCRFFRANFDVVPLAELLERLAHGQPLAGGLAITFDDGYRDNYEIAAPILSELKLPATFFLTTSCIGSDVAPPWASHDGVRPQWMEWEQVRDLAARGFAIGAHTRTHVDLGAVGGDAAWVEISGSRQDISDGLGREPEHFAYPFGAPGNLSERNRQRVREAGFTCCLSCHGGLLHARESPFFAHRVPISPWYRTPDQFGFEVLLGRA